MIFIKRSTSADVPVELKIVGFMGGEYMNIIGRVNVPEGCSLELVLKRASSSGSIPRSLYRFLARPPAFISVLINGEPLPAMKRSSARIHGGDSVSFFTATTGG